MKRPALPLLCLLACTSGLSPVAQADPPRDPSAAPRPALVPRVPSDAAAAPAPNLHILWKNVSGAVSLWNIAPDGTVSGSVYGPFTN